MNKNKLKISSQYQITLPKSARTALDLNSTDALILEIIEGVLCLRRADRNPDSNSDEPRWPEWRYLRLQSGGDTGAARPGAAQRRPLDRPAQTRAQAD